MIDPGTVIDGRYEVLSRIGSGGMADVYLAQDRLLGRKLAVKVLHRHFAEDQEFVERFRREASSAAALSHPNIVGIFDRGEWNGTYYIAMEYVPGRSLRAIVREQGALEPTAAIDVVVQILRAARFAHRRGVIHRDLKPHNVILDDEGRARVTDFGIARAGASDMTLTGSIMGTAQYLSPEQAQGHAVSETSDLYAVGVILYELLTGAVPFDGETAVVIAVKQISAEPRPPSALNQGVPAVLDAVVLRALAKDPAQRFPDADAFIAALGQVRSGGGAPATAGTAVMGAPGRGAATLAAGAGVAGGAGMADALARQPAPASLGDHGAATGADHPTGGGPGSGGPGSGALLLPPAAPLEPEPPERRRRRNQVLWGLGAALAIAAAALALLLLLPAAKVRVPNVTGDTQQAAIATLRRAGLTPVSSSAASATVPSGQVIGQSPARGSRVTRGTHVSVVVSSGPASAAVPQVEGLSAASAADKLRAAGFKPSTQRQSSASVAAGRVIATSPPAGSVQQTGSAVTVLVSSGPARVRVPEVSGQSRSSAEAALTAAGLSVGTVTQRASTRTPGTVLSQSPSAGTLPAGGKVELVVAKAPKTKAKEATVPGVVGQNEAQAAAALGAAGFKPRTTTATTADPGKVGVVLAQSPTAGRHARKGATVTITIGTAAPQTTTPTTPSTPTTTPTTTPSTPTTSTPAPAPSG
jgi:eukaryotic-like serine/threonine-protein kinase